MNGGGTIDRVELRICTTANIKVTVQNFLAKLLQDHSPALRALWAVCNCMPPVGKVEASQDDARNLIDDVTSSILVISVDGHHKNAHDDGKAAPYVRPSS